MTSILKKQAGNLLPFLSGAILTAVVFGVGLFVVSLSPSPKSDLDVANSSENSQMASSTSMDSESSDGANEISGRSLSQLSQIKSDFSRTVALHGLLASANQSDLNELIQQSLEISPHKRQLAMQRAIFQRYATLNPAKALSQVEKLPENHHASLFSVVFGEWSQSNLDKAIAKARTLSNSKKFAALQGILAFRDDLSEDIRQGIARDLGSDDFASNTIAQLDESSAIVDPESSWNILINDDQEDIAQTAMLLKIAETWIDQGGFGALRKINDSLSDWPIRMAVLGTIVHNLVQTDAEGLFQEVMSYENDRGRMIASTLVQAWTDLDPHAALNAVASLESENQRRELLESVVRTWSADDPRALLDAIDLFPEDNRDMGREWAIVAIARNSPEEASQLLVSVDGNERRQRVARSIASIWSNQDVYSALSWVLNSSEVQDMQRTLLGVVLNRLVRVDAQLALETALNQPLSRNQEGLEASVIAQLARSNIQQAIEMLAQVRDGRTKLSAYGSVGATLVYEGEINQALKLANDLTEPSRASYYQSVVNAWSRNNPEGLLESIDQLPSAQTKSLAARALVFNNRWRQSIDEEQLAYARSFLTEQDARYVDTRLRGRNTGGWQRNSGGTSTRSFQRGR